MHLVPGGVDKGLPPSLDDRSPRRHATAGVTVSSTITVKVITSADLR